MLRAFKVNSIDYLLKPIKKEDLERSLKKYEGLKSSFSGNDPGYDLNELIRNIKLNDRKFRSRFLVKKGDQLISIQTDEVSLFYTSNSVVLLQTRLGKTFLLDFTLDELTQQLDPDLFFRANRQFILHIDAVKVVHKWHKGKLLIETAHQLEDRIIISAEKAGSFRQWLGE